MRHQRKNIYFQITEPAIDTTRKIKTQNSPQKITQFFVRNQHYLYIDLNEQTGIKSMERISKQNSDGDSEIIGRNVVSSIIRLSPQNQKTFDYIYKSNELARQRGKFQKIMQKKRLLHQLQLKQKQRKKLKKLQHKRKAKKLQYGSLALINQQEQQQEDVKRRMREKAIHSLMKVRQEKQQLQDQINTEEELFNKIKKQKVVYRGMQLKVIKEIFEKKKLEEVNQCIKEKQDLLMRRYGLEDVESKELKAKGRGQKEKLGKQSQKYRELQQKFGQWQQKNSQIIFFEYQID